MSLLSKDSILKAEDRHSVEVGVPEWGGSVRLRVMTGKERDAYEAWAEANKRKNLRARLVAFCMVDADGKRVFGEADLDALGGKSGAVLDRLADECLKLNGRNDEGAKELEKNSDDPAGEGSSSA